MLNHHASQYCPFWHFVPFLGGSLKTRFWTQWLTKKRWKKCSVRTKTIWTTLFLSSNNVHYKQFISMLGCNSIPIMVTLKLLRSWYRYLNPASWNLIPIFLVIIRADSMERSYSKNIFKMLTMLPFDCCSSLGINCLLKTTTIVLSLRLSSLSVKDYHGTSNTIDMLVAGASIVGRYLITGNFSRHVNFVNFAIPKKKVK